MQFRLQLDNSFQEFNLSTVFTPFTALIFLVSMFNAVVSRTITVKFPWKIPSTESMFRERSVTPVSLLMTEVMLVTIAMVVTADDPERDDISVVPLTAPFGLDDAVTETAEHFLCVRAVHPVDLDALRGDETEHLVAIDRVAALRQLILDARQVLVNTRTSLLVEISSTSVVVMYSSALRTSVWSFVSVSRRSCSRYSSITWFGSRRSSAIST